MHESDIEQVAAIKAWWQANGRWIIISIVVLIASNFGWQQWHQYRANKANHASEAYQTVLAKLTHGTPEQISQQAIAIRKHFSSSPYASLASLQLAKLAIHRSDYAAASKALQWVIDHNHTPALAQVARLRLARVQLAQHQPNMALKTINKLQATSFNPLIAETRGDILKALNKPQEAKQAYAQALRAQPDTANNPAVQALRLKHAQL